MRSTAGVRRAACSKAAVHPVLPDANGGGKFVRPEDKMFSLPKLGVQNNESTPALTSLIPSSQKEEGSVRTAEPATDEENVADEVVELLNPELKQPVISNGEDGYKETSTVPPLLVPDVQWILHPDSGAWTHACMHFWFILIVGFHQWG